VTFLFAAIGLGGIAVSDPAGAAPPPASTVSYYETSANPATLLGQGQAAGEAGAQGLVILDFGRPAANGSIAGTFDFGGSFDSFASIVSGTESYIQGYLATAPSDLSLHVAIGTNNSCGTGQPCGGIVCGCVLEPTNFASWGAQLAAAVENVQAEANDLRNSSGDTDTVTVVAGDDAEPAFDPGFQNTSDLLGGYASAVGSFQPAMIDYGSAEPGYWTMSQLLQVVDGFRPDVAVPEVYTVPEASSWASLISFASAHGRSIQVFGVLTNAASGNHASGYAALLGAIGPITGQSLIRWSSAMSH
jgi:hypothetical protein